MPNLADATAALVGTAPVSAIYVGATKVWPTTPPPFTLGVTKPSAATTGVTPGTVLTKQSGDVTVTVAGTTIQNLDLAGFILVRAANVTIRNCIVRGSGPGTTNTGLIDCNHAAAANVIVDRCELVPNSPSVWLDGVIGHDYTATRCNVYNVVDGFGIYNSATPTAAANVTLQGNYVHDLSYISPDPNHTDNRTHNDGVQIQGNAGITITGNRIEALVSSTAGNGYPGATLVPTASDPYYPSVTGQAIGVTPNAPMAKVANLTITNNWLDGGAQTLTIIPGSQGIDGATFTVTGNRFGRTNPTLTKSGVPAKRAILADPSLTIAGFPATTATAPALGNVYEDDGSAVTIWREVG